MKKIMTGPLFLLFFLTFYISSANAVVPDTLNVLHISDTHVIYVANFHPVFSEARKHCLTYENALQTFFARVPKKVNADLVVHTGDILDYFEAETSIGAMLGTQIEQFYTLYDQCPVSLYMTLGNHDISRYRIAEDDSTIITSQIDADRARAVWIRNIPCFHNGTYYTKILQVGNTKYHFIFLDNGYSLHNGGRIIDKVQLDWLNEQLEKAGSEPVVLLFHKYFSIGDVNGDGIYFKKDKPTDWPDEKRCSEGFLKILNGNSNIRVMLVGHGHSNVFEKINFPAGHGIYQIETGGVGENPDNWRLLQFTETKIIVNKVGSNRPELSIIISD